ncbi:MAG TPA: hypothetical protein PLP89_08315 [Synergistales bacterium]|nr:hypothetical protein [Synergistales bacterium]HRV71052.1 hypothetical protein [Thermovirgaceae bacterium]
MGRIQGSRKLVAGDWESRGKGVNGQRIGRPGRQETGDWWQGRSLVLTKKRKVFSVWLHPLCPLW